MKRGGKKSAAGVSRTGDSPRENSVAKSLSSDEPITMPRKLRPRRLEKGKGKGKQLMNEISEEDEERCTHNREIDQKDDDQEKEDDGGGEEVEAEEEEEELVEGFYVIESIRKKRKHKGVTQYLIKWRDWPESANSWEPKKNLQVCSDLIEAFEEERWKSGRKRKRGHVVTPQSQSKKKRQEQQPQQLVGCENSEGTSRQVDQDEGNKEMDLSSIKISEHNGSRCENVDRSDDVSVNVQELAAPESVTPMNEVTIGDGHDTSQSGRQVGARKRKSGAVKRFKPDSRSPAVDNAQDRMVRTSCTDIIQNYGLDPNNAEAPVVTKVIKPIQYSASASNTRQEVAVTFLAMRSDGTEVFVTNKYLRTHCPLLLIDFYEQHLRYSGIE